MEFSKYFFLLFLLIFSFNFKLTDSKCPETFQCGELGILEFPLANYTQPECGLFSIDCNSSYPRIQLQDQGTWFHVMQRNSSNKFRIQYPSLQDQLRGRSCLSFRPNPLPNSPSISFSISPNLTLFVCGRINANNDETIHEYFQDYENYTGCQEYFTAYYRYPVVDTYPTRQNSSTLPEGCSIHEFPLVQPNPDSSDLFRLLTAEYDLEWHVSDDCLSCHGRGGQCLNNRNEFQCVLRGKNKSRKISLIGGATVVALATTLVIVFLVINGKYASLKCFPKQKTENQKDFETFLKSHGNISSRRYKYSDLKKMTKSFSDNLGKGGYGSVYKGKLPDGNLVAVKLLNTSKGNGEDFMNEIASISRTSHVNIVTLLGFCFEGSKRALIYEFMPNGSLEKFIHHVNPSPEGGLGWQKLFEIVLGIARGLEYLHKGCNTRILHFDIKPHNILLDKDLNPKISDFGLAKTCRNRSSIVTMSVARGTMGYIAPEVFCRNFGEVSYKSDVYSYGMMVLEIVGTDKKTESVVDHSSEIYFPNYIYKNLEIEVEKGGLAGIVDADASQLVIKRKMTIVGLWCIQTDPKQRPSMTRVIEMLEGKLESLQVPPRLYLSSPERSAPKFSISESLSY